MLEKERGTLQPAGSYPSAAPNWERDVLAETEQLLASLPEVAAGPGEEHMLTGVRKEDQPVSEKEEFSTPPGQCAVVCGSAVVR